MGGAGPSSAGFGIGGAGSGMNNAGLGMGGARFGMGNTAMGGAGTSSFGMGGAGYDMGGAGFGMGNFGFGTGRGAPYMGGPGMAVTPPPAFQQQGLTQQQGMLSASTIDGEGWRSMEKRRMIVAKIAEHNQQFPGVLNRSPSDMEEAIYNGSNSEADYEKRVGQVLRAIKQKGMLFQQLKQQNPPSPKQTPEEDERYAALLAKYRQDGHVQFNAVKWLLVGPPQVGKTTTKYNLLGDSENVHKKQPSTGLEPPIEMTYLDSKTATLISTEDGKPASTWTKLSTDDLAQLLVQRIESEEEKKQDVATADVPVSEPSPEHLSLLEETAPPTTDIITREDDTVGTKEDVVTRKDDAAPRKDADATTRKDDSEVSHDETVAFVKQIYKKMTTHKKELIQHLNKSTTVYLIDTGGQPEFHDLLPLLLRGPAFYLIFFSLENPLDSRYVIKCSYNAPEAKQYVSGHSIQDVLYQMLNSFTYSNVKKEDKCCVQPQAFVIATHLDKVSPEKLKAIDEKLRKVLEFKDGLPPHDMLVDATDQFGTLFVPINNLSSTHEELEKFRDFLAEAVKKSCKPIPIAISWLLFHFILRDRFEKKKVCSYEESVQLAIHCGIKKEDVKDVLTYIYRKLGTILYFEDVSTLNHLIICNPEVVYQAISNLIFNLYKKLDSARNTGIISDRVFRTQVKDASEFLDVEYILELLKHFRIISYIPCKPPKIEYFMPCVLQADSEVDSTIVTDPHCLVFCFPFRPDPFFEELRVIPIGLATGLVVHLQSLPPTTFNGRQVEQPWRYLPTKHFKGCYQFQVYDFNTILLLITGKHLEVHLIKTRSANIRARAKKDIKEALAFICNLYDYTCNIELAVRLFCKNRQSPCGAHLVEYIDSTSQLICSEVECEATIFDPSPSQKEWFSEYIENVSESPLVSETGHSDSRPTSSRDDLTTKIVDESASEPTTAKPTLPRLLAALQPLSADWYMLGIQLDYSADELNAIKEDNNKAKHCMTDLLSKWQQKYPNKGWSDIVRALRKMDRNDIADELERQYVLGHYSGAEVNVCSDSRPTSSRDDVQASDSKRYKHNEGNDDDTGRVRSNSSRGDNVDTPSSKRFKRLQ